MNLERFNEYVNKYKAISVSDELKEKTIKAAQSGNTGQKQQKIHFLNRKNLMRFTAIAACFALTVAVVLFAALYGFPRLPLRKSTDGFGTPYPPSSPARSENNAGGVSAVEEETDTEQNNDGNSQETIIENFDPNATNATKPNMNKGAATQNKGGVKKPSVGADKPAAFKENPFIKTSENPVSTFSIDVDTASYVVFRRDIANMSLKEFQNSGGFIRTEEAINYFSYDYPKPTGDVPVAVTTAVGNCPWNPNAKLAVIRLAGKELDAAKLKGSNIVFLIDVSGSMETEDKLPLLKQALAHAVENLSDKDTVSIVTYASSVQTVLTGAKGSEKSKIINAINKLKASGGTAGADGLDRAYSIAQDYFIKGGNNRILLATDGDFNIGPSSVGEMKQLVTRKRESGIFLTVLGFGVNNYVNGDERLEVLADNGNGGYYVIDSLEEAEKVLNNQFTSVLYTVAKDVKIQVEFSKNAVYSYRLIGYENRVLANEDFNNDKVDGGDLGSGQTVTAMYEIIPKDDSATELFTVKIRYKNPDSDTSLLYQHTGKTSKNLNADYYFASAVAEACLVINNSQYKGDASLNHAYEMAQEYTGSSSDKSKQEFIRILKKLIS